ncbi:MAG: hypothetical protein WBF11_09585, partial [Methyloceanibacter sp.]
MVARPPKILLPKSLKNPALALPLGKLQQRPKATTAVSAVIAIRQNGQPTRRGFASNKNSLCWPQSPLCDSAQHPQWGFQ